MRLALMTTECAQVGAAMEVLIERHHEELELVVTSNVERPQRGGVVKQARENMRRSGRSFIGYLLLSFPLYEAWLGYDRIQARIPGRDRRRFGVAELCARHGIKHLETDDINGREVIDALKDQGVDLITIYWFDQIFRQPVLDIPSQGVVNFHAARLPQCRGLFPVLFSAAENEGRFGLTAHDVVDETIDTGPILGQIEVAKGATTILGQDDLVNRAGTDLYSEVIADLDKCRRNARPQAGGSYFSYPTRSQIERCKQQGFLLACWRDFLRVVTSPVSSK